MSYSTRRARARARSVRLLVWAVIWPRCSSHLGRRRGNRPGRARYRRRRRRRRPSTPSRRSPCPRPPAHSLSGCARSSRLMRRGSTHHRETAGAARPGLVPGTPRLRSGGALPVTGRTAGGRAGGWRPGRNLDVHTHATSDAPDARRVRGVILVSPGLGNLVAFSTGQVIDAVSQGWVVVTFEHPHDTYVVEQPDGALIFSDPADTEAHIEAAFAQRVLDVGVVLDHLSALVPQVPAAPVGMFGHSLGGATAAEAMLLYPRLRAGVESRRHAVRAGRAGRPRRAVRDHAQRPARSASPAGPQARRVHLPPARPPPCRAARYCAQRVHGLRGVQSAGVARRSRARGPAGSRSSPPASTAWAPGPPRWPSSAAS